MFVSYFTLGIHVKSVHYILQHSTSFVGIQVCYWLLCIVIPITPFVKLCHFTLASATRIRHIMSVGIHCSTVSAINFFLAHSGHMISSASVIKPLPTIDVLQEEQTKQLLCQCRPSNEMNRVPPIPA